MHTSSKPTLASNHADAAPDGKHALRPPSPFLAGCSLGPQAVRSGSALARLGELVRLPCPSIIDAGANKGRTVDALLALYPNGRIFAYEPHPRLARKLAKRFAQDPRVLVRPVALGDSPGQAVLHVPDRSAARGR